MFMMLETLFSILEALKEGSAPNSHCVVKDTSMFVVRLKLNSPPRYLHPNLSRKDTKLRNEMKLFSLHFRF